MCNVFSGAPANVNYVNDVRRGRHSDPSRFRRLDEYAQKRWERSRDLRYSFRWMSLKEAIYRRAPNYIGTRHRSHA